MPFAVLLQIVARSFIWIVLLSSDIFSPFIVRAFPNTYWYYVIAILLAIAMLIAVSFIEVDGLTLDVKELCLYEVLVHCLGLSMYLSGYNPADLVIGLMGGLLFLRYGRLVWPYKVDGGGNFAKWPTFGLLGWVTNRKKRLRKVDIPTIDKKQVWLAYSFIIICIGAGFALPKLGFVYTLWQLSLIAFIATPFVARYTLNDMKRQQAAFLENISEIARVSANEHAARQIAIEKEKMNVELAYMNEELVQARDRAEQVSRSLRDIAHDLRNPIHQLGFAALNVVKAKSDAEQQQSMKEYYVANDDLLNAIEHSVHYAKLATNMTKPMIRAVDVGMLLITLRNRYRNAAIEKNIGELRLLPFDRRSWLSHADQADFSNIKEVNTLKIDTVGPFVATDESLLMRMLQNLLGNAIWHASPCKRITISLRRRGQQIWLQVWDQGNGIGQVDDLDSVANFQAFAERTYRAAHDIENNQHTHGLGINIVQQLSKIANIQVTLRAHIGRGAVFGLLIPCAGAALIAECIEHEAAYKEKLSRAAFSQKHFQ